MKSIKIANRLWNVFFKVCHKEEFSLQTFSCCKGVTFLNVSDCVKCVL